MSCLSRLIGALALPGVCFGGGLEMAFSTPLARAAEPGVIYRVAANPAGVWVAGATGVVTSDTADPRRWDALLARLNPDGSVRWRVIWGGSAADEIHGLAVDPAGNAFVAGATASPDFPAASSLRPANSGTSQGCGFVAKVSAEGAVVYATLLCGSRSTSIEALAIDNAGAVFVTGYTSGSDFPTTAGAPIRDFPEAALGSLWGFVAKISPMGDRLVYSTFLGGSRGNCAGGSACLFRYPSTAPSAIAVDAQGNAWVTGSTTATDFPVTGDAYQKSCQCRLDAGGFGSDAFLTRLDATGSAWLYSSYLGGPAPGTDRPLALALDSLGRVLIAGYTNSCGFPTTPGVLQERFPAPCEGGFAAQAAAFAVAFDSTGTHLDFSTFLPGAGWQAAAVLPHWDGSLWLSGARSGSVLTTPFYPNPPRERDFLLRLDAGGKRILNDETLPPGVGGGALDFASIDGLVLAGGVTATATNVRFVQTPHAAITGLSSAAYLSLADEASPGERIRVYGFSIGPETPAGPLIDEQGGISTGWQGIRLFVNGVAAPWLYGDRQSLETVIPFETWRDTPVQLELMQDGHVVSSRTITVGAPRPELFRSPANAAWVAAVNNDGTVNALENPAAAAMWFGCMRPVSET